MSADPERVEALFEALADLDPEEAERRLDAECAGDAALRGVVARLLAHDRAATPGFLAPRPALAVEALRAREVRDAAPKVSPEPDDVLAGSARLGRFFVLRKLGEGGMGIVYVGYDEGLDRRVALKLLRGGAGAHAWLLREGQALGRLAHPNVVAVHEVGEHEGRVFLAMELVTGPTLRAWLDERPRPFAETLRLLLEAGRGLAAAHEAGLIHRDFKPDNVLVGEDGRARVVDFGIAALAGGAPEAPREERPPPASALASPLTQAGALMGTPAFMAPEQLRGERATPLSDQWSYCVSLYRAAYGALPFPSDDLAALSQSVLHGAPAPPPRRQEVPAWLAAVLLRGLAREPRARFASMSELLEAIERRLPRDPELDPSRVARERQILTGLYVVAAGLVAGAMLTDRGARALTTPAMLIAMPAGTLSGLLAAVVLRWRRISQNAYGWHIAGLFPGAALVITGHRLLALRLGAPAAHILVEDLVLFATLYGVVALLSMPWLGWLAAAAAASAIAGALAPERAPAAFAAFFLLSVAGMLVRLFVDRDLGAGPSGAAGEKK